MKKKSYTVMTFAELRQKMQRSAGARRKGSQAQGGAEGSRRAAQPQQDGKEVEFDFDVKETGQTQARSPATTRARSS